MKLTSLRNTSDDSCCIAMPMERYGYGLRIYLGSSECEALGITAPIKAGTQVKLQAMAIVTSATESIDADESPRDVCLSLQITDLGLEPGKVLRNAAEVLYGAGGDAD